MAPNTKIFCMGKKSAAPERKTQRSSQRRIPFFNLTAHKSAQPKSTQLTTSLEPGFLLLYKTLWINLLRSVHREISFSLKIGMSDNSDCKHLKGQGCSDTITQADVSFSTLNILSELVASIFSTFYFLLRHVQMKMETSTLI